MVVGIDEESLKMLKSRRKKVFCLVPPGLNFFRSRANETLNRRGRVGSSRYLGATIMRGRNTRV